MTRSFNHRVDEQSLVRSSANANVIEPPTEEKTVRGRTKLKRPRNGRIAIIPLGDKQFEYANYSLDDKMKMGPVLGAILKHEYPAIIKEKDCAGVEVERHAFYWRDYSLVERGDDQTTAADRVRNEFWSFYSVGENIEDEAECEQLKEEADRIFEKYAANQCRSMMYQSRVDAVKFFYRKILKRPIKDPQARKKELTFEQYLKCKPEWITDGSWESMCKYWCCAEYRKKRKLGQGSRYKSDDVAQNRGGSRPLGETQQFLKAKFGPAKATTINTYCCMKAGIKNCDNTGNSGPIPSQRAQQRVDDYNGGLQAAYPDDWQERPFDGKVMYDSTGGMPHGRMAIADGVVKKADIVGAARASNIRPCNSMSYQNLKRRFDETIEINRNLEKDNAVLKKDNAVLKKDNAVLKKNNVVLNRRLNRSDRLIEVLYSKLQMEMPDDEEMEEQDGEEQEDGMEGAALDGSSHASADVHNSMSDQEVV